MTDILERPLHDINREQLQDHLAEIDRDPIRLRRFIEDVYTGQSDNPHLLYVAATHLNSLTHLDRTDEQGNRLMPDRHDARRAFSTYTHLIAMMATEKDTPAYTNDVRVRRRLAGAREELAFHGTLTYAVSHGADFVALPTSARLDYTGANESSDVQIAFPGSDEPPIEIQVAVDPAEKIKRGYTYHPRIPILSLSTALGSANQAAQIRGILRDIGDRDDRPNGRIKLPPREHQSLLDAAASILLSARAWGRE